FGGRDRILLQREFKAVLQHGWRGRGPHLQVIARRRSAEPAGNARLGLSVSKQTGNSPARARMRRLIREAFRALRAPRLSGVDVVVLARIPWPMASLAEVSAEMSKVFDYVCSNLDRERRSRSPGDRRPPRGATP
ncbi:MAG: ribonuclease P protein component, partial [Deltaproteobacteria bacterium]|nr:ribonuclease P protein component [Deltaproteobacteria bacterium]